MREEWKDILQLQYNDLHNCLCRRCHDTYYEYLGKGTDIYTGNTYQPTGALRLMYLLGKLGLEPKEVLRPPEWIEGVEVWCQPSQSDDIRFYGDVWLPLTTTTGETHGCKSLPNLLERLDEWLTKQGR